MKRLLLLSTICLLSTFAFAQTFNGEGDGTSWFDKDNWSNDTVPNSNDNAIIPSGFSVNQGSNIIFVNSLTLANNATLSDGNQISFTGTFTIEQGGMLTINSGGLNGGGTLNSEGIINVTGNTGMASATTLNNEGEIIINNGSFQINGGALNNEASGTIEIQSDDGNITSSNFGVLNNEGLIKKTTTNGSANLQCSLNNDNGTIQVENGTLVIASTPGGNLTNGLYNVFPQATLDLALTFAITGTLEGNIDGTLNFGATGLSSTFNIAPNTQVIFDFLGNGTINFLNPTFAGGGTLTNKNIVNFVSISPKRLIEYTTFNNESTINILSSGNLVIDEGTFNNLINGTIDMQADSGNITWGNSVTHILNNEGLIKKTTSSGEARIQVELNNNDGEIRVENGILTFLGADEKNLVNGTYNVNSNAVFNWTSDVSLTGNISGIIDGNLNWNNDVIVTSPNPATFNFTGTGDFNWTNNALRGGGLLTNNSVLNLSGSGLKQVLETTYLDNTNTINFTSSGGLNLVDGFLTNYANAMIDLQADNCNIRGTQITSAPFLNNPSGIIRRSNSSGTVVISAPTINNGYIELLSGELEFMGTNVFENSNNSYILGNGTLDVPPLPDYINDGIISPGLSLFLIPGTLTIEGNFKSSSSSGFLIDINGSTPGTEHDFMQIQGNAAEGNAIFEGTVYVTLGFEPSINDEFIIATTTGTITTCNLTSPTTATYNGNTYTFDIICRNDNEVVLTVVDPLSVNEFENKTISIYPNPTHDELHISNQQNTITRIELWSLSGQLILDDDFNGETISLSKLSEGIYLLKLYNDNGNFITKKIIKQ